MSQKPDITTPAPALEPTVLIQSETDGPLWLTFSDGEHQIPPMITAAFGDYDSLRANAPRFATITFAQFMQQASTLVTKKYVSSIGQGIINGHMRKLKAGEF